MKPQGSRDSGFAAWQRYHPSDIATGRHRSAWGDPFGVSRSFLATLLFSALAVGLALAALNCKEDVVLPSGADLVDPSIMPSIVRVDPAIGSVGPYDGWGNYYYPYPQVTIWFNKHMDASSVRRSVRITSSIRPIRIDTVEVLALTPNEFRFAFGDSGSGVYVFPMAGESFTISLAAPVRDVNGNALLPCRIGSFIPEPQFRVVFTYPSERTRLSSQVQSIEVNTNGVLDSSILRYVTFTPPSSARLTIDGYMSRTLVATIDTPKPSTIYSLTIAPGAHDRYGHALTEGVTTTCLSDRFRFVSAYPMNTLQVFLNQDVRCRFSLPIDTASIRSAVHLVPDNGLDLAFGDSWFSIIARGFGLSPQTEYTVMLDSTIRSTSGATLDRSVSFTFMTDSFRVRGSSPENGMTSVRSGVIRVFFSAWLDSSTIRRSISIVPSASLEAATDLGSEVALRITDSLKAFTAYTVTVDTSIRSAGGLRMAYPHSFSFTTGDQ